MHLIEVSESTFPSQTVAEARAAYFRREGLGVEGYEARWVKLKAGPIPLFFPNSKARVRAVKLHDLHHVATEYPTTWTGEAEIAAWELAAGCHHHHAAWVLNASAMAIGLVIAPRATYRAFVRGRHSRSLYEGEFSDDLLELTLADLRQQLQLDTATSDANASDKLAFAGWVLALILPKLVALGLIAWLASRYWF